MCGLAGILVFDESLRIDRDALVRMGEAIAHRGPDSAGVWLAGDAPIDREHPQCGLSYRRLSVLDLDARSNQPMHSPDRRYALVFNGEIYNFRELRQELVQSGAPWTFVTTGDAEVLLAAFATWGEKCLEKLNGMFAFAIWDGVKNTLTLARDRMGQKPLYYSHHPADPDRAFAFASEVRALTQLPWIDKSFSPLALRNYLRFGYVPDSLTIYANIDELPPGQWMTVPSVRTFPNQSYFDAGEVLPKHDGASSSTVRELVTRAVKRQLVSDVPLGCFLSGGTDSSVIALAMKLSGAQVKTFTVAFDDARYDESQFAQQVASHLGTEHQCFTVKPDAASDLPKLARVLGEPFGDSSILPTHYLAMHTRQHVTVALSGDGGDELFGGYDRYRAMRLASRMWALAPLGMFARLLPSKHPKSRRSRARRFLRSLPMPSAKRYSSFMRIFDDGQIRELLNDEELDPLDPIAARFMVMNEDRDAVESALAVDRATYLPGDLLMKVDRASMLHSLEVRSPFMDHELVLFAASLSTRDLLSGGGKRMLREAFANDLPEFVFKRPKMGFALPIGDWLRKELKSMLMDAIDSNRSFARKHFHMASIHRLITEHMSGDVDHTHRLFAILMLELWWHEFGG